MQWDRWFADRAEIRCENAGLWAYLTNRFRVVGHGMPWLRPYHRAIRVKLKIGAITGSLLHLRDGHVFEIVHRMRDDNMRYSPLMRLVSDEKYFLPRDVPGLKHQVMVLRDEVDQLQHARDQMAILGDGNKRIRRLPSLHVVFSILGGQPHDPAPAALHRHQFLHGIDIDPAVGEVHGNATEYLDAGNLLTDHVGERSRRFVVVFQ